MTVLAIDPGPTQSAWLVLVPADDHFLLRDLGDRVTDLGIQPNAEVLTTLRDLDPRIDTVVIEWMEGFGMAVGREVFETVHWSGRFTEAVERAGREVVQLPRKAVKLHLCGSLRAKDPNIRQALIDRFGGAAAKGTKAAPGPLYGVSKDLWSALAIAVTHVDSRR
jgi:hypothetical protein